MNFLKYSFWCILFLFAANVVQAQEDLESEEVEIIRDFDARLIETEKINVHPTLPNLDTTTTRQRYDVPSRNLSIEYPPPRIRPLAIRGNRLPPSYKGYLKAGGGIPNSIYGEGRYNTFVNKNFNLGLRGDYHYGDNGRSIENQKFANLDLGAEGTYYTKRGPAVKASLGYINDVFHYYGYNADSVTLALNRPEDPDNYKQTYSIFDAGVKVFNGTRTTGDFNYSAGIDFYGMGDRDITNETGFDLKIMGEKWIQGLHSLSVGLETDFTNYSTTSDSTQKLNNFYLTPAFTYHGQSFRVKAGANIVSSDDQFSFFPDAEIAANVVPSVVSIFVGASGGLNKNSFRNLAEYNPYIVSRLRIGNTKYWKYYGGAQGNVRGIGYRAEAGYKVTEDLAVFNWDRTNVDRFTVDYLDFNIFNIKVSAEATIDDFKVSGALGQSIFNPVDHDERPWHLPSFEANASVQYSMQLRKELLQVKAELFMENGVPYRDEEGLAQNLNGLFDISMGAEYFFSKNFGAFLQVNNIANNRRQRWYRYPTFGLNALGGINLRF